MREHRKMTLKRIGIGILCMVFVLSDQCKKQRKCRRAQRADRTGYQECIRLAL